MKYTFSVASSTEALPVGTLVATRDNVMAILGRGSNPATEKPRGFSTEMIGKVIDVASSHVRADFPSQTGVRLYPDRLYILTPVGNRAITKTIKWHGTNVGELEDFLEQLHLEGGTRETEFHTIGGEHLHIHVELPLATKPEPEEEGGF